MDTASKPRLLDIIVIEMLAFMRLQRIDHLKQQTQRDDDDVKVVLFSTLNNQIDDDDEARGGNFISYTAALFIVLRGKKK